MGHQTVTLILEYLQTHPGIHTTAEVAERTGTNVSTASRNLLLLAKHQPGVQRVRAGIYLFTDCPAGGPESNGTAPAQVAFPFAQEQQARPGRDRPLAAVRAEPDRGDDFSPRYGPPFRIRIESSFVARSGRTCYRIRAEGGREGTLFWEDEPWPG